MNWYTIIYWVCWVVGAGCSCSLKTTPNSDDLSTSEKSDLPTSPEPYQQHPDVPDHIQLYVDQVKIVFFVLLTPPPQEQQKSGG